MVCSWMKLRNCPWWIFLNGETTMTTSPSDRKWILVVTEEEMIQILNQRKETKEQAMCVEAVNQQTTQISQTVIEISTQSTQL